VLPRSVAFYPNEFLGSRRELRLKIYIDLKR
jgi:hypothetical protein